jgi:hypothetical protein
LKSNNGVIQNIIPADLSVSVKHGSNSLIVAGADYQHAGYNTWSDPLNGYHQYGNKSNGKQAGIYAQEEYRFNEVTIRAGVRYSYTESAIALIDGNAPGQNSEDWSAFLWSGGVRYHINENVAFLWKCGKQFHRSRTEINGRNNKII